MRHYPLSIFQYAICLCALCVVLASCNDASCYDNGSALPLVRFCASGSTTQVSIEGLTIRGIDAPGDSVLVQGGTTSEVYLPLRATTTCTQWELDYPADGSTPDTLTIAYQPIPYFASAECGAMYNFQISSATVTHHLIDSVQVVKPLIDNGTDVAIRLFFPTQ